MTQDAALSYRSDIDGLRGIAILSVIVYHIDERWLPGGFIGVDVFFVISGYLITQLIMSKLDTGGFSLWDFYRRRIKRIAPAMMVVIAATLAAAQFLLLPDDALATAHSAIASIAGIANVYFWLFLDTGYFAPDAREIPLLHLWSLGVEEQFYLLWPLLLFAANNRTLSLPLWLLAILAAASFAGGTVLFAVSPGFVFYMLPTRAGELLAGAILAIGVMQGVHRKLGPGTGVVMAVLGAVVLTASFILISNRIAFPGLIAVAPVMATVALILAGAAAPNIVNNFLSNPVLRWTGLVSYSAYLWHWPLLAFSRYGYGELTLLNAVVAFVGTFILAYLSYRYIETPTRASTLGFGPIFERQYLRPAVVITGLAVLSIAGGGYGLHAFSPTYTAKLEAIRERLRPPHDHAHICQRQRLQLRDLEDPNCAVGDARPRMLLWGDSNASHYVGVIRPFAQAGGFGFRNAQIQSCPPIHGDPKPYLYERDVANCRASLTLVHERMRDFDVVAMAASWPGYQAQQEDFLTRVLSLAKRLESQGKLVLLLGKAPVPEDFDRRCEAKALRFPSLECARAPRPLAPEIADINAELREFAADHENIAYFDLTPYLCPTGLCISESADGQPLYVDPHHLSLEAAQELGQAILTSEGLPDPFGRVARWGIESAQQNPPLRLIPLALRHNINVPYPIMTMGH